MVISTDGSETKTGFRLETVNTNESSGTTWGGSYSYAEMLVGEVPLVDPSADQSPDQYSGQSPDGTPPVPPPNPVDVPDHPDSAAEPVTTIFYTEQWEGSQSQHDYDSYSDVTAFGFSGVTTTTRLGFGGGGYLLNLESSSVLDWNQTTGDIESPNWSVIAYHENSQVDLTHSGGYLSLTSLTITDGGSNPLMDGVTGSYLEDGSDHTNILITTLGTASYADASVITHDGPTVEPTVTSAISSVDNSDQTIHIISGDEYSDIVTFSGNDSLTLDHSQTDTFSFALTSLGDGTLSLQTEMDYPQDGNSLATFTESYTQTMLLDSGSTTNSSFTAQTDGEDTTVTLGPIAETGTSASSFDYAATGTSTFQSSETGTYTAPVPSADPNSGEPIDPNQAVSSPFTGLPTLTVIDSNETWTDSLSFSDQSEYEQTINFNPDDSWSLNRTETGSGTSSFDQTLISSLTINDEVGSIDDGLGAVFTYGETNNLHSWNDGDSSYVQTLSLISSAPTDPDETTPPDSETTPPDNADITILLTHDETGESSSGLDLETTGSQSYQAVGMTETIVESTPPTDGSPPTTLTEPVSFELATSDNWQQTLSILGTVAYTTGLTLSSQDGLALDVSQTGESHSALHSEFSSTYNLLTETTHADLTSTTALYEDQSTLAYVADDSYLYSLESHLAISNDDEVTISGTLVESSDGASNGTAATNGSYQTSTNQAPSTPGDLPLVLQTSEDIWTDQLTFNDLYEFDRTTILNADGSFTIDHQQSGSGDSDFDHTGSGTSDDADETTPAETYQHHIWENSDYSYTLSATIASTIVDTEATLSVTDFSYVSTSHVIGAAELNGTSDNAKSLIGALPITDAATIANGPVTSNTSWDDSTNQQLGNGTDGEAGETQFVAAYIADSDETGESESLTPEDIENEFLRKYPDHAFLLDLFHESGGSIVVDDLEGNLFSSSVRAYAQYAITSELGNEGDVIQFDDGWRGKHADKAADQLLKNLSSLFNNAHSGMSSHYEKARRLPTTEYLDRLAKNNIPLAVGLSPKFISALELKNLDNGAQFAFSLTPVLGTAITIGELTSGQKLSFTMEGQRKLTTSEYVWGSVAIGGSATIGVFAMVKVGNKYVARLVGLADNVDEAAKIADDIVARSKGIGGKGWRGDKVWRDQIEAVRRGGDIDIKVTPTRQEAIDLIEAAGGKIDRIEGPHLPPNPHQFPHINFTTPGGKKGTIPIVGL